MRMRNVTKKLINSNAVLLTVIVIKLVYDVLRQFNYKSRSPILTCYHHTRLLRRSIIQLLCSLFYITLKDVVATCKLFQFLPELLFLLTIFSS